MRTGRPKEDLTSLPENWYNEVLDLYKIGATDLELFSLNYEWRGSFSNILWERWMKEEPQFWETIKIGRKLAESWWNKNGRTNLQNKDFSYTGWYMQMKNRYGWTDRSDHTTNGKEINTTPTIVFKKFNEDERTE